MIVIANRGPYREVISRGKRKRVRAAGGLVTALDPVLRARGGVWVSVHDADTSVDMTVPDLVVRNHKKGESIEPEGEAYGLASVPLSRTLRSGFYDGISNAVLWPLMHSFPPTIRVGEAPWSHYVTVNRAFVDVVLKVSKPSEIIWIQDYHLMLLPAMLRVKRRRARIGWFCHIPWPNPDIFGILPWRDEILAGLLGADVLAFHTDMFARNFLACVERFTSHKVDHARGTVRHGSRSTRIEVSPIGIPVEELETVARDPAVSKEVASIKERVNGRRIILGVDRLDYTKGIPERILAFEKFLTAERKARNDYVYVQIMVPSRTDVAAYAELKREVDQRVGDINGRFSTTGRVAIHYLFQNVDQKKLFAHYRAADVALVTPLRDGMNLVCQEYCVSRFDNTGALVLSEFAGAARHLKDAILVNPYNIGSLAEALSRALNQSKSEQARRMRALRSQVYSLDVHGWAKRCIASIERA